MPARIIPFVSDQHYHVFNQWLSMLNISVVFLSSSVKPKERRLILQAIASHSAQIIIGTHALLQKDVTFSRLALIVIDEQHRFGVEQRSVLKEKGQTLLPHQLIMTATPIPRTLAMTLYSELATSIINEMPANKATITTSVMVNTKREMITERIQAICQQGQQVYWVCPLIETSQQIEAEAVLQLGKQLQKILKPLQVAVLHGQMRTAEKTMLMKAFQQGALHVLVATTIIEVGIDVPNASLMIIENAERLGLAQLHQLRGRVGRGTTASHCLLLYQPPLSEIAKSRLQVMRSTQDGFKIAEHDLTLRGPGELLGTRQTGAWSLQIADLMRDHALLAETLPLATTLMTQHPEWVTPLIERWLTSPSIVNTA